MIERINFPQTIKFWFEFDHATILCLNPMRIYGEQTIDSLMVINRLSIILFKL